MTPIHQHQLKQWYKFPNLTQFDDNVPLSSLQVAKADKEWKWRKQFKRAYVEKCVFAEDGTVNIDVQDPLSMQVFAKMVGLEGLLSLWKTESERYTEQNRRMFVINILMGIHKLPNERLQSVDEGLDHTFIKKMMTKD